MRFISILAKTIITLLIVFSAYSLSAIAKPMNAVDMIELKRLSSPKLSPDGEKLIYLYSVTDWEKNKITRQYKLLDVKSYTVIPLDFSVHKKENFSQAYWRPDSQGFITILRHKCEKSEDSNSCEDSDEVDRVRQAFYYDLSANTLNKLTNHHSNVSKVVWKHDASGFYFLAKKNQDPELRDKYENDFLIKEYEFRQQQELLYFDINKATSEVVLSGDYFIRSYSLASDGKSLLYTRASGGLGDDRHAAELYLLDIDSKESQRLTRNSYAESSAQISPDNTHVAYISETNEQGDYYYDDNLFIQKLGENTAQLLFPDIDMELVDFAWGSEGNKLFLVGNIGLTAELFVYDIENEKLEQLTNGEHEIRAWSYDPQLKVHSMIVTDQFSPGEIYSYQENNQEFKALTSEYEEFSKNYILPKQEAFVWYGKQKQKLEGLLVYPLNYQPGKSFPLVTLTHGGPRQSVKYGSWNYSRYVPVFAAQGYGVFLPNHRGSSGYGDAFLRDMVGGYFTHAQHDVLDGIDALIDKGLANPNFLIKGGWSAGGHMTTKLITLTDRFKAASSGAGASDWVTMYGESDVRYGRKPWFGKAPWEKGASHKKYLSQSALQDAWRVKTPTLFFVGEKDVRVPPTQSIIMYRGLKAAKVDTELYIAPGQGHGFSKPKYRLFKINKELEWYAKHVFDEKYQHVLPVLNEEEISEDVD